MTSPYPQSSFRCSLPDAEPSYVLVRSGPDVPAADCELPSALAVEILVRWGKNVLFVTHLSPPRAFVIGEGEADFVMPVERLQASRLPVLSIRDGVPYVEVPPGARVTVNGEVTDGASSALVAGRRVTLELGDLAVELAAVAAGKPVQRALLGSADRSAAAYWGLSFFSHAAILGALAFFTPPLGLTDDESLDAERLITMQQYLTASAEREREREPAGAADERPEGSGERGEAALGEAGKMGKPFAERTKRRSAVQGPADNPDPHLQRQQALREAQDFGMVGLLTTASGDARAIAVPWGRNTSLGTDPLSAVGEMWGDEIGDSAGAGGLALSGLGDGGGGKGEGIGLDRVGTCGSAICSGLERGGFGSGVGQSPNPHKTGAPRIRPRPPITSGALPPEVIQRVVRQNFGRFRMCYEDGLRKNPNLEGRIEARFVIGRDGAVSNVRNGASDLPDSGVVSCVIGTYYGLSFPPPTDGIVTVSYPIFFSPSG